MAIRDLREDIRQRLQLIAIERGQIQERLSVLEETEQHLRSFAKYEEMRVKYEQEQNMSLPFVPPDEQPTESERSLLSQFLRRTLADAKNWSLDELKEAAIKSNLSFDGKNPGRVLHFALLGMSQSGLVQMVEKGVWRMSG
jgi:hypothetical protein